KKEKSEAEGEKSEEPSEKPKENKKEKVDSELLSLSALEDEEGNLRKRSEAKVIQQEKKEMEIEQQIMDIREELGLGDLQPAFNSGATVGDLSKYLYCGLIGRVISVSDEGLNSIEVIYDDSSLKKNVSFLDPNEYHLATLNQIGVLFANKKEEINLDEYENEDDIKKRRTFAVLHFRTTHITSVNFFIDWTFNFPSDEDPILLSMGNDWCAAYSSNSTLRIFSIFGGERLKLSLGTTVIAMTGHLNYLCYVYHSSIPFEYSQQLRFKILDAYKNFQEVFDDVLPISNEGNLIWFGYSEEGILLSYDSYNILRGFFFNVQNSWIPLIDLGEIYQGKTKNFWVTGSEEGEIFGIEINGDLIEPPAEKHPIYKSYKFIGEVDTEHKSSIDYFFIKFLEKRYYQYSEIKDIRYESFPESVYDNNIKEDKEIIELKKEHDKKVLSFINDLITKGEINRVINYFESLFFAKSKEIIINLAAQYEQIHLARYLNYKKKLTALNEEENNQKGKVIINRIVNPNENETEIKKEAPTKVDLSSMALNLKGEENATKIVNIKEGIEAPPEEEAGEEEEEEGEKEEENKPCVFNKNVKKKSFVENKKSKDIFSELGKNAIKSTPKNNQKSNPKEPAEKKTTMIGNKRKNKDAICGGAGKKKKTS
ncbi:MAG: hypothetical protein MJ252_25955, partial [archaeon]|nr:hypothetical protein [archaeon]